MHANGLGVALTVLLVSPGCSCGDDGGGGGGAADGGGSADSGGEVDGGGGIGLIVHVGYLTSGSTTWVVLGDGEEYQKLESTTDAVFPDARLPQDVHHVQLVPFRLTGAELVPNKIDKQRKQNNVAWKRDPREHRFADAFKPELVQRANHYQINDQQQEQPFDRQLMDLARVDHGAKNTVAAHPAHVAVI